MQRRKFKHTQSLEVRLAEEAKRLRQEAKLLPPTVERDELIRRARQAEHPGHREIQPEPGQPVGQRDRTPVSPGRH